MLIVRTFTLVNKLVKISSLLLVVIVAVGSIGINILSYCCNHKEIGLFSAVGTVHSDMAHAHYSHNHHKQCNCSLDDSRCENSEYNGLNCCSSECSSVEIEHDAHDCHTADHCMKNDFIQLKPVKNTDYVVCFIAPLPIVIELFDFSPKDNTESDYPLAVSELPPNYTGRDILAKHAILLI